MTIRTKMENNAAAYNKHLTKEHLKKLSIIALLSNTYPVDRTVFIKELQQQGILKRNQVQELLAKEIKNQGFIETKQNFIYDARTRTT